MSPQGPIKLVTVNSAPERAYRLVGRVAEDLKEEFTLLHVGNAESPELARAEFIVHQPDVVFAASMWTEEQSSRIFADAREVNPNVKTLAIPQGLQVEQGPDAVVAFIKKELPRLLQQ